MDVYQEKAIKEALKGHNLLIVGQSGTGKSVTVGELRKKLINTGKKVCVTGTTGVASLNVNGVTVHSWSGIMDGRFSDNDLLNKFKSDEHFHKYKSNIEGTDVLIIDEISMLSAKLFDQIEFICRKIKNKDLFFGGIQVIAVGDFFQLPPVPDLLKNDQGDFCFKSNIFQSFFKHKMIFNNVKRQDETDLVKAVNDVSKGDLPVDTLHLLTRLQRPLPPGDEPLRLFSQNFDKDVYNAYRLIDLDGETWTFHSIDEGDCKLLKKIPVPKTLFLKLNCPVMLVKNLSDTLVNGLQGKVVNIDVNFVSVKFGNVVSKISRQVFSVYSSLENRVIASRHQLPLVLSYGVTIHKAQGLTLERIEVDCSNIFMPGQLGVAIGRVRQKKGLRILNFLPQHVIKPDKSIFDFYNSKSVDFDPSLECCKLSYFIEEKLKCDFTEESDSELSDFSLQELQDIDSMFVVSEIEDEPISSAVTENESDMPDCPINVNHIRSCLPKVVITQEQKMISSRLSEQHQPMNTLIKKLYEKISSLIQQFCGNTGSDAKTTDSKTWTSYYSQLYQFCNSKEYISIIESCIQRKAEEDDFVIFSKIFDFISNSVLEKRASSIKSAPDMASISSRIIYQTSGLGKLRYISGRCIAKLKHHLIKLSRTYLYNKKKFHLLTSCFLKVKILDFFSTSYSDLSENSCYKDSLEETHRKQNISQKLTNIKDVVLDFFIEVDKKRSEIQTEETFHIKGSNILKYVHDKLLNDEKLFHSFKTLLQNFNMNASLSYVHVDESLTITCLKEIYEELIIRFCRVADNQFRKNLIMSFGLQKTEALRKRVVGTPRNTDSFKISMSCILNDKSENKISSHLKLQCGICDLGESVFKSFTKKQLFCLSAAYNLNMKNKMDKKTICDNLILQIPKCATIPNISVLSTCFEENIPEEGQPSTSKTQLQSSQSVQKKVTTTRRKRKSTLTSKRKKSKKNPVEIVTEEENTDNTLCAKCFRQYDKNDDWVQCDLCDEWYDRYCQNMDEEIFNNLDDDWYCNKCCS